MKKLVSLLFLISLCFIFSCDDGAQPNPNPEPDREIPADLLGTAGSTGENEDYAWDVIHDLKITWITKLFRWSEFQSGLGDPGYPGDPTAAGVGWNWTTMDNYVRRANQEGMKIIATIGCSDKMPFTAADGPEKGHYVPAGHIPAFANYIKQMVSHYSNNPDPLLHVDAWEIWNEGNYIPEWWEGTTTEFYALHKAVVDAVREVNPDVPLLGFAATPVSDYTQWSKDLITFGAAPKDKVSGASFHPYAASPVNVLKAFESFKSSVASGGLDQIWITEVGFPAGGSGFPTIIKAESSASYTAETIALLAAAGVPKIFWYEFSESRASPSFSNYFEDYFGLTWWWQDGGVWKCARQDSAAAFKLCATYIPGTTYKPNLPERQGSISSGVRSLYFEGKTGTHTLVLWNEKMTPQNITVFLPGTGQTRYNLDSSTWEDNSTANDTHKDPIPESIGNTTDITLGQFAYIYTWTNNTAGQVPRISAR
ncbi:hypothetical protein AGMMS49991_10710 [Spirochaetia bacterium]|nr:hypothetical protein AGMMS49991_10710 [Spirochaetia bacterium]